MRKLQGVTIDKARWPRIYRKLKQAGFGASCKCNGCASCQTAAKRLVRYAAQSATHWVPQRNHTWVAVARSPVDRPVRLFIDRKRRPAVIDISLDGKENNPQSEISAAGDDTVWNAAIDHRSVWPGGATTKNHLKNVPKQIGIDYPNLATQLVWQNPTTFANLGPLPDRPGLYFIVWENGAYLGRTGASQGIKTRVGQHLADFRKISFVLPSAATLSQYHVIGLPKTWSGNPSLEAFETKYLNRIAKREPSEPQSNKNSGRLAAYGAVGFRNLSELEFGQSPSQQFARNPIDSTGNDVLNDNEVTTWLPAIVRSLPAVPANQRAALADAWSPFDPYHELWYSVNLANFTNSLPDINQPGLFIIRWNSGHYLGETSAQTLYAEINRYLRGLRMFMHNLDAQNVMIYWLRMDNNPREQERDLLTAAAALAPPQYATVRDRLNYMGFRNSQREY